MEEARVVAFVGIPIDFKQARVNPRAAAKSLQLTVLFYSPIFAHPQEDNAVNGHLNREVELAYIQIRVPQRDISCQNITPNFYFL